MLPRQKLVRNGAWKGGDYLAFTSHPPCPVKFSNKLHEPIFKERDEALKGVENFWTKAVSRGRLWKEVLPG